MQMSHFSTDLQHSLTGFHKPTSMDPSRFLNPGFSPDHTDHDRLSTSPNPVPPYDKETMFEKPLTPSDVGKLNRLVIPKQHAEKYFPLGGCGGSVEAAGGLLGFEDESGKCWRFRYSYWNSSQSYVLTKGWSRYVKDKGLDAGDVVFFERHRSDPDRLFIGWRRRGTLPTQQQPLAFCYNAPIPPYQRYAGGGGGAGPAEQEQTTMTPAGMGNNNSTRLVRLFGVNLECQSNPDTSFQTTSSQSYSHPIQSQQQQQQEAFRNYFNYMGHHQHHMVTDMDLTQGVNQMGNRLG